MPYEVIWEPHGAIKKFTGFMTGTEFVRAAQDFAADPRFDSARYVINDFLEIDGHSVGPDELEELAVIHVGAVRTNPRIRVAFVSHDAQLSSIKDFIAMLLDRPPYDTRQFGSLAEARAWAMP